MNNYPCQRHFREYIVFISLFLLIEVNSITNPKDHRVILISFDGFRWDYLNGRARTPTFDFMKSKGVHATEGIQNVYITNTLPNHMSMATGLYVESHGMMDNIIFDPQINDTYVAQFYDYDVVHEPAWLENVSEPVWISNQIQNHGKSGVLMWMHGETTFHGVRPTKFTKYSEELDELEEMKLVVEWLTDEKDPIDLAMMYFPEPDFYGHIYGPESIEVSRKIEYLDKAMGQLLHQLEQHGLADKTDIIVTSDHGFTSVSKDNVIRIDDIVDPSLYQSVSYMPGPVMAIFPIEGMLDVVYEKLKTSADNTGHFHVYKSRNIPERFHYKSHHRVPPIFATAVPGYSFSTREKLKAVEVLKGNHGYDNAYQEMRPFFVAYGPSFKEGFSVKTFENVDIYPLICHLKGIQPFPNNGSMDIVSRLLRHYPEDQSHESKTSRDILHGQCHSDNVDGSCPLRYKDVDGHPLPDV